MRHWLKKARIWLIAFRLSGQGIGWISVITLAAVLATIVAAVYLAGVRTEKWPEVADAQQAFQDNDWPDLTPEMRKVFLAEGGLRDELRARLVTITDNRERVSRGEAPHDVADIDERKLDTPARQAQWAWVDSQGCGISGWNRRDTELVALLVRHGVWACSDWRRAAAATPLVQRWGLAKGMIATLAFLGLMIWLCWQLMQFTNRARLDGETNRKVYLSRLIR